MLECDKQINTIKKMFWIWKHLNRKKRTMLAEDVRDPE